MHNNYGLQYLDFLMHLYVIYFLLLLIGYLVMGIGWFIWGVVR